MNFNLLHFQLLILICLVNSTGFENTLSEGWGVAHGREPRQRVERVPGVGEGGGTGWWWRRWQLWGRLRRRRR
jgi:hypothetical protein